MNALYNNRQIKHLRGLAHSLKPVVRIGQRGLTDAVRHELDVALQAHELLKVKIDTGDRQTRDEIIESLCRDAEATLVQRIGKVATIFRRNEEKPKVALP